MNYEVDYKERMINYYPPVIQDISDFKAIIDSEYPELSNVHDEMGEVLDNSFLFTMTEERISQWEKMLDINVSSDSTLENRRDVIIARLRGQGKLNTELINAIVNTFTGGSAISWVEDSTLHVEITPPPDNKQYRFEDIERELQNKVPSHLGLEVIRNYYSWGEVTKDVTTWNDVKNNFNNWEDVLLYVAS